MEIQIKVFICKSTHRSGKRGGILGGGSVGGVSGPGRGGRGGGGPFSGVSFIQKEKHTGFSIYTWLHTANLI